MSGCAPGPARSALRCCASFRWLIRRDLPEVLEIEQTSFEFPWTEADFLIDLAQRNHFSMVAEYGELVTGFIIYELQSCRLQLVNFAVHPAWRRQGVGSQMVDKLVSKLSGHGRTHISARVRETNLGAQLFFRANGFRAVRVHRGYFEDTGEDAYLMVHRLKASGANCR